MEKKNHTGMCLLFILLEAKDSEWGSIHRALRAKESNSETLHPVEMDMYNQDERNNFEDT